jgi:hypothetical protein
MLLIVVLIAVIAVYYLVPVSCDALEFQINEELDGVNYCIRSSDCAVEMRYGCPFGCYQFYNKGESLALVDELVESYESRQCSLCVYSCLQAPQEDEIGCVDGKCVDLRVG